jgi:ribosomal protein S18 acetylase RimI-like enzyme
VSGENLERMIRLAEEFFETKNDPAQISVSSESMGKLRRLHPATLTEQTDADGPIAWVLVIPTTMDVMQRFVAKEINERELLDSTIPGASYDALYLCSALVLPEHRGKGIAKRLLVKAVGSVRQQHPIRVLF